MSTGGLAYGGGGGELPTVIAEGKRRSWALEVPLVGRVGVKSDEREKGKSLPLILGRPVDILIGRESKKKEGT